MEYRAHDWLRAACCEYYRPSWPSQPFVYSDFNFFVWQRARFGLWKRRRGGKLLPQSTVKNLNLFDATYQIRRWMKFYVNKTWKYKLPKGRRLMTGYMQPSSITCDRLFTLFGFMTGYMQPSARDCWRNGHHLFYAKNFSIPREEVCPCREQLRWSRPV